MNKKVLTIALVIAAAMCSSCSKKEEHKDIIVNIPKEETPKGTQQMTQTRQQRQVEWLGNKYEITILRQVDKSLPKVSDENGTEYYDNNIQLRIKRADGSDVINRTFKKTDFAQYTKGSGLEKSGALLGIVFDKIENNKLVFATSVGSPDVRSDEFIPLIMTIDCFGNISISLDTQMDSGSNNPGSPDSNGITGDEEA